MVSSPWAISAAVLCLATAASPLEFGYHYYEEMTQILKNIAAAHPDLTHLYSIGRSVQERELWVMVVSRYPQEDPLLVPNVQYIANMHGNEAVGRELMLHLIEHLITSYRASDPEVRRLMDNTRLHIMPSLNPDGFELSRPDLCVGTIGRYNARGVDLNRNFPDYFRDNSSPEQPETRAVMDWIDRTQFVLSANFHGGALVASYPFDNFPFSGPVGRSRPSPTPDEDVFRHLALTYSFQHASMHQGVRCRKGSPGFPNGTTNGAAWYPLTGGMQDYSYVWGGQVSLTLEVSCCKFPVSADLPSFWEENRAALIRFVSEVHRGVKGIVKDTEERPLTKAILTIKNRNINFQTTRRGEFWRILLPGTYTLEVRADGYLPKEIQFPVRSHEVTVINVTMTGLQQQPAPPQLPEISWEYPTPPPTPYRPVQWPSESSAPVNLPIFPQTMFPRLNDIEQEPQSQDPTQ